MKRASITEAKNGLSRLIDAVREGNTVWITDRGIPVACLAPPGEGASAPVGLVAELVRAGAARPPREPLSLRQFLAHGRPRPRGGASAVAALMADRSESP